MNGNALKVRRVLEKHKIIGPDTAPFIYYIEEIEPYADLLVPVYSLLEKILCARLPRPLQLPRS